MDPSVFFFNATSQDMPDMMSNHMHSTYEIYFLEKGQCTYFINNRLFEIRPYDIVLIPKDVIHKTSYSGGHSRLLVNFNDEYLDRMDFPGFFVFRNRSVAVAVRQIMKEIETEYLHPDRFSEQIFYACVLKMLSLFHRFSGANEYKNSGSMNAIVESVIDDIYDNYAWDITLGRTAEKHGISGEYLSRLFKKETGVGFNEYLSLVRMRSAAAILKSEPDESISRIAGRCGFSDSNYFCVKFKKAYGVSPSGYRKTFFSLI